MTFCDFISDFSPLIGIGIGLFGGLLFWVILWILRKILGGLFLKSEFLTASLISCFMLVLFLCVGILPTVFLPCNTMLQETGAHKDLTGFGFGFFALMSIILTIFAKEAQKEKKQ
jgi:hypothetical protein